MMGDDGNVQRIDRRFRGENCSGHDFLGDDADLRVEREQRNSIERLQSLRGKRRISRRRFVEHILGRYQFIIGAFFIPPLVRKKLSRCDHNLGTWPLAQVTDDGRLDVQGCHRFCLLRCSQCSISQVADIKERVATPES